VRKREGERERRGEVEEERRNVIVPRVGVSKLLRPHCFLLRLAIRKTSYDSLTIKTTPKMIT